MKTTIGTRLLFLSLLLGMGGLWAAAPPDQSVRDATDKVRTLIREHKAEYLADPAKFYAMVDKAIVPHFDQPRIGKRVLGPEWRKATEAQRTRFNKVFKNSLIHSYADALLKYEDTVDVEWKPTRSIAGAEDASVDATLKRKDAPPVGLSFSVVLVNGQWKIYDVSVENVSLASGFRAQFAPEIKKNGLDGLIQKLESGKKPM